MDDFLTPEWSAPTRIKSVSTTRRPGVGKPPFDHFNIGNHVGDDPQSVARNRQILREECHLPGAPQWLNQVHGKEVVYVKQVTQSVPVADAAWTDQPGCALAVMTADCLPVLLSSRNGDCVAVVHGGWKGLAGGVLEATINALPVDNPADLVAWLGPAIGAEHFEVGAEVRRAFIEKSGSFTACFVPAEAQNKYMADLFEIGRSCLLSAGVELVAGGGVCTFQRSEHFFSHRRDAGRTGRMASVVWIEH